MTGLQVKLKKLLPYPHFEAWQRIHFLHYIYSGILQQRVLGFILYLLFTAELPTARLPSLATFVNDTASLAYYTDIVSAFRHRQTKLNKIQIWLKMVGLKLIHMFLHAC